MRNASNNVLIFWGFLIVFFALFWKKIFGSNTDEIPQTTEDLKKELDANNDVKNLNKVGVYKSFSLETYKKVANELYEFMDGVGTDEASILKKMTFYVKNDVDFINLFSAFGYRNPSNTWFGTGGDLRYWLKSDLSTFYINQINDNYKSKGMLKRI